MRNRRKLRIIAAGLILLVTTVGVFLGWELWRSVRVESIRTEIAEAGDPVTLVELDEYYPHVPARENAAPVYGEALRAVSNPPGALEEIWPPEGADWSRKLRKEIEAHLEANAEALRLLEKASQRDTCRYPIDLTRGTDTLLPHLGRMKPAIRLLCMRASYQASQGDLDEAIESLALAWATGESLKNEPTLISQRVRLVAREMVLDVCERLLGEHRFNSDQLEALATLMETPREPGLKRAAIGERAMGLAAYRRLKEETAYSAGRSVPDQEIYLRAMNAAIDALDSPFPQRLLEIQRIAGDFPEAPVEEERPDWQVFIEDLIAEVSGAASPQRNEYGFLWESLRWILHDVEMEAGLKTRSRALQTVCAVEKFRLRHDRRPGDLSELSPEFEVEKARSSFTGEPLTYELLESGYIIKTTGATAHNQAHAAPSHWWDEDEGILQVRLE